MSDCRRRDAERAAKHAPEAVCGKRQQQSLGSTPALLGNCPPAYFRIPQLVLPRPCNLGINGCREGVTPGVEPRQRRMLDSQVVYGARGGVLEVPDASADRPVLAQHHEMPAVLILGRFVKSVGREMLSLDGAIGQIDGATKPLHFFDKSLMLLRVQSEMTEATRHRRLMRRQEYEPFLDGRDIPF